MNNQTTLMQQLRFLWSGFCDTNLWRNNRSPWTNGLIVLALFAAMWVCGCSSTRPNPPDVTAGTREREQEFGEITLRLVKEKDSQQVTWFVNRVRTTDEQIVLDLLKQYQGLRRSARVILTAEQGVPESTQLRAAYLIGRSGLTLKEAGDSDN